MTRKLVNYANALIARFLVKLFDKPPKPLATQEHLTRELQRSFEALPVHDTENRPPSQAAWLSNLNRLRELMLHDDPRCFLRWDVLQRTMFVAYPIYILKELRCLKSQSDWKTRWRPAIMESPAGHPTPYPFMPQSSGNLIHQAYHLCQFETKTGRKVHTFQRVVEFGGGYGRLCSLLHKLGFSGKYLIYDLLPFTLLQKYYLRLSDLPIRQVEGFRSQSNGIWCLSDYDQLKALLTDEMDTSSTLFVAIWSLSETPYNVREAIWKLIKDFDANLIAYQKSFGEMNNLEFFAKWRESLIPKMVWHNWEIEHLQGNYYLVGDRKIACNKGR